MMRPTLHRDLTDAVEQEGILVRLGTTVTALQQSDGRVSVTLSDGTQRDTTSSSVRTASALGFGS
jgi:2-polyprenyl-6-methoxyphenol hydroxylase-like FAD-dependent oxidoreductase